MRVVVRKISVPWWTKCVSTSRRKRFRYLYTCSLQRRAFPPHFFFAPALTRFWPTSRLWTCFVPAPKGNLRLLSSVSSLRVIFNFFPRLSTLGCRMNWKRGEHVPAAFIAPPASKLLRGKFENGWKPKGTRSGDRIFFCSLALLIKIEPARSEPFRRS